MPRKRRHTEERIRPKKENYMNSSIQMDCKIRDSPEVERGRVCVLFLSTQLLSKTRCPPTRNRLQRERETAGKNHEDNGIQPYTCSRIGAGVLVTYGLAKSTMGRLGYENN